MSLDVTGVYRVKDGIHTLVSVKIDAGFREVEVPASDIPFLQTKLNEFAKPPVEAIGTPIEPVPFWSWMFGKGK